MSIHSLLLLLPLFAPTQDDVATKAQEDPEAAVLREQLPSYPLDTCVISGEELGSMGKPIDLIAEGRLLRLCCKGCVRKATADPTAAIAKVEAAVVRAQGPFYPLEVCVVSGEEVGSMGDPVDVVVGTRLIRVCCKGCAKKAKAKSAAHLARIDAALIEAQRKTYPLATCVVSDEELGSMGDPVEVLYGVRLVRLCCKGCEKAFAKDPEAFLAKVAAAKKKAEDDKRED